MPFFFRVVSSRRQEVKAKCSLTCEYLTEEDYTDLLWTTLSEFPGKEQWEAPVLSWNWFRAWEWALAAAVELGCLAWGFPCCNCGSSLPWDHSRKNQSLLWNGPSVCSNPAPLQEEETDSIKGAETLEFLSISDCQRMMGTESMENLLLKFLCPASVLILWFFRQFQQISMDSLAQDEQNSVKQPLILQMEGISC